MVMLSLACQQRPAVRAPVKTSKCTDHALEWVKQFSSSAHVSVTAIAASGDGGVIAIGEFKQSIRIAAHNWLARAEAVDVIISEKSTFVCSESSGPDCKSDQGSIDCKVVMANACSGLLGVVCAEPDADPSERKIDEFYLWRSVR